ncbi:unnamed protein product [Protopolystoma xenopodis]|uniref:Uncharacterized protein n=1 Tax=Protopolystoma xenopodis TaxID=117903 RepID=A0A3S5A244_9PLAT|nr:unnamed protein product [Protopolystoma xenopodis]
MLSRVDHVGHMTEDSLAANNRDRVEDLFAQIYSYGSKTIVIQLPISLQAIWLVIATAVSIILPSAEEAMLCYYASLQRRNERFSKNCDNLDLEMEDNNELV